MADNQRPFLGTEALSTGSVTRRTLNSRYRRLFRNVYIGKNVALTPMIMAEAAWLFSERKATLAGVSAAAIYGDRWLDAQSPPELIRPEAGCAGILVHRAVLDSDEMCTIGGMQVTTAARTAFDLGRRGAFADAVIRLDALAHVSGLKAVDLVPLIERHRGARGLNQLRNVVDVMDGGAESPPETRTRLVLLDGGLPRPRTQVEVFDAYGYPYARIDMGYGEFKVGVEYDGQQHWTDPRQRAHDVERAVRLAADGWTIVRVYADMLRRRPQVIVQRTAAALTAAGCRAAR